MVEKESSSIKRTKSHWMVGGIILSIVIVLSGVSVYLLFFTDNTHTKEYHTAVTFDSVAGKQVLFNVDIFETSSFLAKRTIEGTAKIGLATPFKGTIGMPDHLYIIFPGSLEVSNDGKSTQTMGSIVLTMVEPIKYEGNGTYTYQREGDYGFAVVTEQQIVKIQSFEGKNPDEPEFIFSKIEINKIMELINPDSIRHIGTYVPETFYNDSHISLVAILITLAVIGTGFLIRTKNIILFFWQNN